MIKTLFGILFCTSKKFTLIGACKHLLYANICTHIWIVFVSMFVFALVSKYIYQLGQAVHFNTSNGLHLKLSDGKWMIHTYMHVIAIKFICDLAIWNAEMHCIHSDMTPLEKDGGCVDVCRSFNIVVNGALNLFVIWRLDFPSSSMRLFSQIHSSSVRVTRGASRKFWLPHG